jgi:ubiquitin C-terminal hydrolase
MMLLATNRKAAVDPQVFLTHLQIQMRTTNDRTEFHWNKQHDVPEVLEVLIDAVNSECTSARSLSEIVEKHTTTCTVCSYKSSRVSPPQTILWVDVMDSVSAMVKSCSVEEVLEGDNACWCVQCGRKQKAVRRSDLTVAPQMLALAVRNRFLQSPVPSLPTSPLTAPPPSYVRNSQRIKHFSPLKVCVRTDNGVEVAVRYDVTAVIHHEGRRDRGHYFAHINRQGRWFRCNDRAVTPSVLSTLGNDTAYVILCKKVQ